MKIDLFKATSTQLGKRKVGKHAKNKKSIVDRRNLK